MDNIYRENILDHYKNPRNFGHLKDYDLKNEVGNPSCGDKIGMEIKLSRRLRDPAEAGKIENGKLKIVKDVNFFGEGCAISMASASILTDYVKNKNIEEIQKLGVNDILKLLGITLTPTRLKCALLPLEVLHKVLLS